MKNKISKGFSLIEVMISLVVLAVGVLALSSIQTTLIKNSSNANQRSIAVSLAQKKIDDLKSYSLLTSGTTWAAESIPASGLAFSHIADNAGGSPVGSSELGAGNIQMGNTTYTLSWTVENYIHNAALSAPIVSTPPSTYPDMKLVSVAVTWDDELGEQQQVMLSTVIDSYPPTATALSDNSSIGSVGPLANYTPEAAPDVIDIEVDTGDGINRQASKPLPDAVKTGSDSNTHVTFEVMSYYTAASEIFASRQEEFETVDCTCTLQAGTSEAFPPAHVVWDEDVNDRYDYVSEKISKITAAQTNNANDVDELCAICCRDHHDADASAVKYVAGTTSGNHTHYRTSDGAAAGTGDEYSESCRLKRVDGILRVFQDWNLIDLTVMNRTDLADGSALQAQYQTYVQQLLLSEYGASTVPSSKPALRTPIQTAVGNKQQLESRGVYLDKVYQLESTPGSTIVSTTHSSYINDTANLDRLEKVPFAELNLTLLSQWSSASTVQATVTNEPVATISDPSNDYYGTYSRGWIDALVSTGASTVSGVDITASIEPSNDGITQLTVNPSPLTSLTDTVDVRIAATGSNVTVTGELFLLDAPGGVKVTLNTAECTFDSGSDGPYTCSFSSGTNVTISITAYKKNTCEVPNGTFSQLNVTSDVSGADITIDCVP